MCRHWAGSAVLLDENGHECTVEVGFAGGEQAFFMQSDIAAAVKPKWYLLGTDGAIVGDWRSRTEWVRGPDGEIDEQAVLPTDLPARLRVLRPDGDGGVDEETLSLPRRDRTAFYRNLAGHLLRGEPLAVTRRYSKDIGAVLAEVKGTTPGYGLKGDEIYVRARITSSKLKANPYVKDEFERAWTQPLVTGRTATAGVAE